MINCQNTTFNPILSSRRLEAASKVFGEKQIKRLFAIVLYWLGVNRQEIADSLGIPVNTVKSFIKTLLSDGIAALVDRRQKEAGFLPKLTKNDTSISWTTDDENFVLKIGTEIKIQINLKNKLYLKTIVLTMLNSELLKTKEAAEIIQLSVAQTNKLAKKIQYGDIDSLIDQRKGLTKDYVMTPEIKSQLIEQYVLACVKHQKTSGKALKEQLKQEQQLELSERTIRYHVAKLGLAVIKKTIPRIIDDSKKKILNQLKNMASDFLPIDLDFYYSQKITITSVNRIQLHAQIPLLYRLGFSHRQIAAFVNRHKATVARWIQRFTQGNELKDRPRSGRPLVYGEIVRLKAIAIYCQTPPLSGVGRLSVRDAQDYCQAQLAIPNHSMSYSTIGRILRDHSLRPHLTKYFLNITDPEFFPKASKIIDLNIHPDEFTFSGDECPGIQALMPLDPDLPAINNKPNYRDFSYSRKGTTDLIAFFRVNDGQVFGRCAENHNRHTFISVFKEHVKQWPKDKQLHYILDNYKTHCHEEFCQSIAKICNVRYYPLKTVPERCQWLQSSDKRVVIHFTPFHGSWLNPIEIWFRILSQKCLKPRRFESVEALEQEILNFIATWNEFLAHPFNWTYTGEGLHEKVVSRFNKLLLIESSQMDVSFLNKQFQLMVNILRDFPDVINTKQWNQLQKLTKDKYDFMEKVINKSSKPRVVKDAWINFDNFKNIMNCQI